MARQIGKMLNGREPKVWIRFFSCFMLDLLEALLFVASCIRIFAIFLIFYIQSQVVFVLFLVSGSSINAVKLVLMVSWTAHTGDRNFGNPVYMGLWCIQWAFIKSSLHFYEQQNMVDASVHCAYGILEDLTSHPFQALPVMCSYLIPCIFFLKSSCQILALNQNFLFTSSLQLSYEKLDLNYNMGWFVYQKVHSALDGIKEFMQPKLI